MLWRAEDVRRADEEADKLGLPTLALMETAGRAVAEIALAMLTSGAVGGRRTPTAGQDRPWRVTVLAGKGHNGGDGLVAARWLALAGAEVTALLTHASADLAPATATQALLARGAGVTVLPGVPESGSANTEWLIAHLSGADLVVDALLGVGLTRPPDAALSAWIDAANASGRPILAVDLPSGLASDGIAPSGPFIRAAATVTFGKPKPGLFAPPGREATGGIHIASLGITAESERGHPRNHPKLISADMARSLLPTRPSGGHKGTFGHLVVVAGSPGFWGAGQLAASAALRVGAGRVTWCPVGDPPDYGRPEVMTRPLPASAEDGWAPALAPVLDAAQAVVVGPGLTRDEATARHVAVLLEELARRDLPAVVDATALHLLAPARPLPGRLVLTPHPGEAAALLSSTPVEVTRDLACCARRLAERSGQVVALKGPPIVVARPDGGEWWNATGNAALATAGSGDVLAGAMGGLLAQGLGPEAAALLGSYLHGLAGEGLGVEAGALAGEVADALPAARAWLARHRRSALLPPVVDLARLLRPNAPGRAEDRALDHPTRVEEEGA